MSSIGMATAKQCFRSPMLEVTKLKIAPCTLWKRSIDQHAAAKSRCCNGAVSPQHMRRSFASCESGFCTYAVPTSDVSKRRLVCKQCIGLNKDSWLWHERVETILRVATLDPVRSIRDPGLERGSNSIKPWGAFVI